MPFQQYRDYILNKKILFTVQCTQFLALRNMKKDKISIFNKEEDIACGDKVNLLIPFWIGLKDIDGNKWVFL